MYVKVVDGAVDTFPYNLESLSTDFPNVSFPDPVPENILNDYGIYSVSIGPMPDYNPANQRVLFDAQPTLQDGQWVRDRQAYDLTEDQQTRHDERTAIDVRRKRNKLLTESDWTQMNDSPLDTTDRTTWATYRQSLRDLTSQDGFPHNVTYPSKPE